jgi:hypothetical protein
VRAANASGVAWCGGEEYGFAHARGVGVGVVCVRQEREHRRVPPSVCGWRYGECAADGGSDAGQEDCGGTCVSFEDTRQNGVQRELPVVYIGGSIKRWKFAHCSVRGRTASASTPLHSNWKDRKSERRCSCKARCVHQYTRKKMSNGWQNAPRCSPVGINSRARAGAASAWAQRRGGAQSLLPFFSFFVYSRYSSTCNSRCLHFHIFFTLRINRGYDILLRPNEPEFSERSKANRKCQAKPKSGPIGPVVVSLSLPSSRLSSPHFWSTCYSRQDSYIFIFTQR